MFDMSWGEVMLIGGVALIVIGPKELPKALRTLGQVTSKVKRMAYEFHAQFNEAMREAELDEVRRDVEGMNRSVATSMSTGFNPIQTIRDEIRGAVDAHKPAPAADFSAESALPAEPKPTQAALAEATAQLEAERREEISPAAAPPALADAIPVANPDLPPPAAEPDVGAHR